MDPFTVICNFHGECDTCTPKQSSCMCKCFRYEAQCTYLDSQVGDWWKTAEEMSANETDPPPPKKKTKTSLEETNSTIKEVQFMKLSELGIMPVKATKLSAGYDLFSAQEVNVPAHSNTIVATDIAISIPYGCYGRIAPRSSLALKHQLDIGGGVIDADYRGNIKVIMFNHGNKNFLIQVGDKIAQIVFEKIAEVNFIETKSLSLTERGDKGFGSTGY